MTPHSLDTTDPDYNRGQMAARIAFRECHDPRALVSLRHFAASQLDATQLAVDTAQAQLRHARGFADFLIALQQETTA